MLPFSLYNLEKISKDFFEVHAFSSYILKKLKISTYIPEKKCLLFTYFEKKICVQKDFLCDFLKVFLYF